MSEAASKLLGAGLLLIGLAAVTVALWALDWRLGLGVLGAVLFIAGDKILDGVCP